MYNKLRLSGILCTILLLSGCISGEYHGKKYPATASIEILASAIPLPDNYIIIGRGNASGEFSASSNAELQNKLEQLGMANGANAMVILGVRIIQTGTVANPATVNFIEATDDPDQAETEVEFNNILADPPPRQGRFERVMYADFLRKIPLKK